MRIRQVALAARELDPVVEDLCAVLELEVAFRDPGVAEFGLVNALMPVGDTFLEVVAPVRDDAPVARFLDRRGDAGYMLLIQTGDLKADRERLADLGVRIVWHFEGDDIAAMHLHPRDVGAALLSLDQPEPPDSWRWGGPGWQRRPRSRVALEIAGTELRAQDPEAISERWSRVLGRPRSPAGGGAFEIALDRGRLRFAPGASPDGIAAFEIRAEGVEPALARARERGLPVDGTGVEIGGVAFRLMG